MIVKRLTLLDETVFVGLGLNDEIGVSLTGLEALKVAGSPPSHGPKATNSLTYVNNAANLDPSKSAVRHNGSAKVLNQIISCKRNLIDTSTGSFSGKKVDYNDIILFVDVYIDYSSQGMSNQWMDLNHEGKIDSNDVITFAESYVAYWNGQP
jgi:hypothetical protein